MAMKNMGYAEYYNLICKFRGEEDISCGNGMKIKDDLDLMLVFELYKENPTIPLAITSKEVALNVIPLGNVEGPSCRHMNDEVHVSQDIESSFNSNQMRGTEIKDERVHSKGSNGQVREEVRIDRIKATDDDPLVFKRIFIMFEVVKQGFLCGCKPFIGLDGCHLKGPYDGIFLCAIALDGNKGVLPLAFAIVESKCGDS
ncbi:hypothetical protein GH714_030072 [Hevea brasiliensis]|uniref:MULE transposase domain-containing protein n=1 Tax=Hevea brasiliensis TaxID=3981 RepID=A0A6A6N3J0_HEVBR|nr:hypothetical protein GH714_030072 [Hevea brasiliensis]